MKKLLSQLILIIIFMLYFPVYNFAQNYQPLIEEYEYYYKTPMDEYFSSTVRIDSLKQINDHTVFYLNYNIALCDTCQMYAYYYPQPVFLQKTVHIIDENTCWLEDTASWVLKTNSNAENWIFDTSSNITAQITGHSYQEILPDLFDSVITIELSNNSGQIQISKSHGITSFFWSGVNSFLYTLAGLKTPGNEYGLPVYGFSDYFNLNVGDIFQYDKTMSDGSYPPPNFDVLTLKKTIISKETIGDTIRYEASVIRRSWVFGNTHQYNETLEYIYKENHLAEQSPGIIYFMPEYLWYFPWDTMYSKIFYSKFSLSDYYSLTTIKPEQYDNLLIPHSNYCGLLFPSEIEAFNYGVSFSPGLGITQENIWTFEQGESTELVGYIKNGDTTGIITEDGVLLKQKEVSGYNVLNLFPNPAQNTIKLYSGSINYGEKTFQISDIRGNKVMSGILHDNNETEINIRSLKKGIYFFMLMDIENKHIIGKSRFVKQ